MSYRLRFALQYLTQPEPPTPADNKDSPALLPTQDIWFIILKVFWNLLLKFLYYKCKCKSKVSVNLIRSKILLIFTNYQVSQISLQSSPSYQHCDSVQSQLLCKTCQNKTVFSVSARVLEQRITIMLNICLADIIVLCRDRGVADTCSLVPDNQLKVLSAGLVEI